MERVPILRLDLPHRDPRSTARVSTVPPPTAGSYSRSTSAAVLVPGEPAHVKAMLLNFLEEAVTAHHGVTMRLTGPSDGGDNLVQRGLRCHARPGLGDVPHRRGRRSESDARCCVAADTQRIHNVRGRQPLVIYPSQLVIKCRTRGYGESSPIPDEHWGMLTSCDYVGPHRRRGCSLHACLTPPGAAWTATARLAVLCVGFMLPPGVTTARQPANGHIGHRVVGLGRRLPCRTAQPGVQR